MGFLNAILGIVSLVGSIIFGVKSENRAKETEDYNKELNQKLMDREDTSWQRTVEDRSKAGLSVAGLTQGAGSGGTVSQLQSQQSSAFQSLSNVLQNGAGTMFGLANSAYDRKLQKQIATDELQLKKQQLKNEKLTSRMQYLMDLAQLKLAVDKSSDEHKIFMHNYKIATGEYTDPKYRVYGSEPSEIERLLTGIYNNRDNIFNTVKDTANKAKDNVITGFDNALDNIKDFFKPSSFKSMPQKFKDKLSSSTLSLVNNSGIDVEDIKINADGKYVAICRNRYDGKKHYVEIPKSDVDEIKYYFGRNPFDN